MDGRYLSELDTSCDSVFALAPLFFTFCLLFLFLPNGTYNTETCTILSSSMVSPRADAYVGLVNSHTSNDYYLIITAAFVALIKRTPACPCGK